MVEALGIDLKEIIFAIANFLILLAVLAKFMYKPFLANLERRKQMIEDAISNAEAVNKRADEKMNSYNKRIAGAEREAAGIINEAKIKADKQASQIIDDANEKAALIMQKAEQEIGEQMGRKYQQKAGSPAGNRSQQSQQKRRSPTVADTEQSGRIFLG